jgi:20S proteasome subunit alpha 6
MFKSQYSSNPIIFSPDGQLLQLSFAKKASDRGEISLSIKSRNHVVLLGSLKSDLFQSNKENRLLTFGNNFLIITSGVSKDGKYLNEILKKKKFQQENSSNRFCNIPDVAKFCSKVMARNTYYSHTRLFGVKLILIGYDSSGPFLFDFNPDGSFQEFNYSTQGKGLNKILGILQEFSKKFENFSLDELLCQIIFFYIKSLENSKKKTINENSICLSSIGKNLEMFVLKELTLKYYLKIFQKRNTGEKENYLEKNEVDESESTIQWSTYESDSWPMDFI